VSAAARRTRLLLTTDAVGGVWQYATELASALVPLGMDTVLAVLGPPLTAAQRARACAIPGLDLIETAIPLDWLAESAEQLHAGGLLLAEIARRHAVDLIQLNQPAFAAQAAYPAPVLAVTHSCLGTWWETVERGPLPAEFAWRVALHGGGLRAADRVLAPSSAFAEQTQRFYKLADRPAFVHNGRTPLVIAPAAAGDYAFTAGRLWDRGKDVATLDRAAARLPVPFKAAGSATAPHGERIAIEHLAIMGHLDDAALAACLQEKPVFVSAARYEPFGLAVLEAAAAGCPLVLSDIPTFRELWHDAAIFVAPGDDRGFAEAIRRLIDDESQRQSGGAGARRAARRFSPDRMAGEMMGIYGALLQPESHADIAA
jgi:glycosyltransferase involved in cell wall biosynthesis